MGVCIEYMCQCFYGASARCLAAAHRGAHNALEIIDTLWYQLALASALRIGMWPNFTTGRLDPIPNLYVEYPRVEQCMMETTV